MIRGGRLTLYLNLSLNIPVNERMSSPVRKQLLCSHPFSQMNTWHGLQTSPQNLILTFISCWVCGIILFHSSTMTLFWGITAGGPVAVCWDGRGSGATLRGNSVRGRGVGGSSGCPDREFCSYSWRNEAVFCRSMR